MQRRVRQPVSTTFGTNDVPRVGRACKLEDAGLKTHRRTTASDAVIDEPTNVRIKTNPKILSALVLKEDLDVAGIDAVSFPNKQERAFLGYRSHSASFCGVVR